MHVGRVRIGSFRCLDSVDLELSANYNLVYGRNASGKTSFLEALAFLGRGKSFRSATTREVVRRGEREFHVFAEIVDGEQRFSVGIGGGGDGLDVRSSLGSAVSVADVARLVPLQVIDPDVHDLVAGGPDVRRRFLDWVTFHVEHAFVDCWRQFRRALRQRNGALKAGGAGLGAWDRELSRLAEDVDDMRRAVFERLKPLMMEQSGVLLGGGVDFVYQRGWPDEAILAELFTQTVERDYQYGSTQYGPQRAEIALKYDDRRARRMVSRGQQKLLASSMVLAATELVQSVLGKTMVLLLDDPAAELDGDSLSGLMQQAFGLGGQLVVTSLNPALLDFPAEPKVFHVEHGKITAAAP